MRRNGYLWMFETMHGNPKVAQQNITELTNLASGLLEFERAYLTTHGEKTPVFRLLSMINTIIREEIDTIERDFADGSLKYDRENINDLPF